MRGLLASGLPASGPKPEMTFATPGGRIACMISIARSTASGACSAVFITSVLPAISEGPSFAAIRKSGAFHGMMAATTPSGSRVV